MKKIGIITPCGNQNFGNKLQNYATVFSLRKMGYEPQTIWIDNTNVSIKDALRAIVTNVFNDYVRFRNRRKYFVRFNKNLNIKHRIYFPNDISRVAKKIDIFLVGSDQVWNPDFFENNRVFLLEGIKKPKIAFSASFGVSNFSDSDKKRFRKGIVDFDKISVREDKGRELVEDISGRKDAVVLVDPTMLLSGRDWDKIAKKPKNVPEKYILNYFLGKLSLDRRLEIERVAKEKGCEIINILDEKSPFYNLGPREFLYLEKNAELICTDSFHSCVFAILYNRPFVIFDRIDSDMAKMNSRLDTLLKKFKLKGRKYNGKNITKENLCHDYAKAYAILKIERRKSFNFLKNALGV